MPEPSTQRFSDKSTIFFMIILSFVCALILSLLASALAEPKEIAKELDKSQQMMIAAKIMKLEGYFILPEKDKENSYVPAKAEKDGLLAPADQVIFPARDQIIEVYKRRFKPFLVNSKGERTTFEEAKIDMEDYIADFRKTGYYLQPWKLIYEIMPNESKNEKESKAEGYLIPINGYGLWDAIYGFLAIKPDGNTIIGISWYDQKETPGLGANISEAPWQSLFPGKVIFQASADGTTDFKTAPLGIVVVRGKVAEVLGNSPKAKSAVDGMAGATLTGNGVTKAYQDVLSGYRPFLLKLVEENKKEKKS